MIDAGRREPPHLGVVVAAVVAVYIGVIALSDPAGTLGTDTGAKVATLDRMVADGTAVPDIGYWAAEWDPDGTYHPFFDTRPGPDDTWINVTTLPMLEAARPLYALGGYRLSLVLPMLGALLAAFAARDLAHQIVADDEAAGTWAFGVVALASPVAIYAVDLWEHSLGAGFMVVGIAAAMRLADGRPALAAGLVAGASFGAAATMRTESLAVAAVAIGLACLARVRTDLAGTLVGGALSVVGFAVPWAANAALEDAVGGNSRSARAGGTLGRDVIDEVGTRAEEALVTWFGVPLGSGWAANVLVGGFVVAGVLGVILLVRRDEVRAATVLAGLVIVVYLLVLVDGGAFVSGALVASPVAIAAVAIRADSLRRRYLLAVAVLATLLTWAFQFTGGAGPQWGGRYLLAPTVALTVLGVVAIRAEASATLRLVVAPALVVTLVGFGWVVIRTNGVADTFERLVDIEDDVVISTNGFLLREGGAAVLDETWLSIGRGGDLAGAVEVAGAAGAATFGILTFSAVVPDVDGEFIETVDEDFLDIPLHYHRFRTR